MKINPQGRLREAVRNALSAKLHAEQVAEVVHTHLLSGSPTIERVQAELDLLDTALNRVSERLLALASYLPDRDFEVE